MRSRYNCSGSFIVPFLGVISILIGLFVFSQLSSESYQAHHGGWQDKIALIVFATLFSLVGVLMTFFGLFLKLDPEDKKESKSSSSRLSTFFLIFMVLALFVYMSNWSWQRLEDYADDIVYFEFPQSFIYDKLGTYDFPLSFYQYKPSAAGNHKKHYLDLDLNQYQLSVAIKDSSEQYAVSVTGKKLHITNAGDYVLTVDIKEGADTPYEFKREFPLHDLLLKDSKNINTWLVASLETIPELLQQRAKIQVDSFGYRSEPSLAELQDGFYLKDSLDFLKISFAKSEKTQLKTRPQGAINSFFHGHKGLIYSFGGTLIGSKKQPDNLVYTPQRNEWRALPAMPIVLSENNKQTVSVVAVYSVADKLFVMARAKDHFLYQFDLTAQQPWKLVALFSIDDDRTNWQYLDDKTLVAYVHRISDSAQSNNRFIEGYLRLLDLQTFQVTSVSTTSTITSYASDFYNLHAYDNSLYLYSSGQFYLLEN